MVLGSGISPRETDPPAASDGDPATGPLPAAILDGITAESERVRAAVASLEGLSRIDGDDERHVSVTVVMVVTDRQIYFVSGDGDGATDAGSLAYADLAAAGPAEGTLELQTTEGVTWRFPLPEDDAVDVDAVVRDLAWIGDVRGRLVAAANDVELAVGEIGEAAEAMEWDEGAATYEATRDALDRLADAIYLTEPIEPGALAPELTDLERTIERAYAELLIERADSRLTLGQQLVGTGDDERARDVIRAAHADFEAAREHADAVQRGDEFLFGEQRELRDRLRRLGWEIEAAAAEPLRRAHVARIRARSTTAPAATVEHWETAFREYGTVLTLHGDDEADFVAGDVGAVRDELANAAGQLIAIHRTLARNEWDAGIATVPDDHDAGLSRLAAAVEHLERAHEIAAEFRPDAAEDMTRRLEKMEEGLERLQSRPTFTRSAADEPEEQVDGDGERAADANGGPDDLASLDTHHEIRLDGSVRGVDGGESADEEREAGEIVLTDPDESTE